MGEEIVIGIVVALTIAAHIWLFKWVRFKIDEGTILKFFHESKSHGPIDSKEISSNTNLSVSRVSSVCSRSKALKSNSQDKESWHLC